MKKKGIEMDYGKGERMKFLNASLQEARWDRYVKWILIVMVLYFGFHIYNALAGTTPVIVNQPDGGQTVCIMDGRYITCY